MRHFSQAHHLEKWFGPDQECCRVASQQEADGQD
jgi:hypothetical protein